jgi:spermidine/putrescine transport system substrate-binding protein
MGDPLAQDGRMADRTFDRRSFLRRAAVAGVSVPFAGGMLAACTSGDEPPIAAGSGGTLPIDAGLVLASGLPVERNATLRVYQWKDYLSSRVLDSFTRAFAHADVRLEVESFLHIDQAVARLQQPDMDFDVVFPTVDVLRGLVDQRLLRPLNHDYLPNLANLWPQFRGQGPFYDPGASFTTPYTVYSSGVGWRQDLVPAGEAPDMMDDPFDVFWDGSYRDRVGMYDNYLEALSLSLLRAGVVDLRGATDDQLAGAADALEAAVRRTGVRFTEEGAEEGLPEGEFAAHQAWSGDVLTAPRYAENDRADVARTLRYWSPAGARKVVGVDLTAVAARGRNPVLAHAFLNHLLAFDVAMDNFSWNGYQPPVEGATREAFADPAFPWRGAVPENLLDTILTPAEFDGGQMLVGFGPTERARWLAQWNRVPRSS